MDKTKLRGIFVDFQGLKIGAPQKLDPFFTTWKMDKKTSKLGLFIAGNRLRLSDVPNQILSAEKIFMNLNSDKRRLCATGVTTLCRLFFLISIRIGGRSRLRFTGKIQQVG